MTKYEAKFGGVAQLGEQAGGQEFDSPHLHQFVQLHAPKRFFSALAYQHTRRAKRKSLMHVNLNEFSVLQRAKCDISDGSRHP